MEKLASTRLVDYALWGGIVGDYDKPDSVKNNMNDLVDLHNCGVAAFKGFTCPNGDLFPTVNMGNVRKALEILKPYGALCGFHCEEYGQVLRERKKQKQKKEEQMKRRSVTSWILMTYGQNMLLQRMLLIWLEQLADAYIFAMSATRW